MLRRNWRINGGFYQFVRRVDYTAIALKAGGTSLSLLFGHCRCLMDASFRPVSTTDSCRTSAEANVGTQHELPKVQPLNQNTGVAGVELRAELPGSQSPGGDVAADARRFSDRVAPIAVSLEHWRGVVW